MAKAYFRNDLLDELVNKVTGNSGVPTEVESKLAWSYLESRVWDYDKLILEAGLFKEAKELDELWSIIMDSEIEDFVVEAETPEALNHYLDNGFSVTKSFYKIYQSTQGEYKSVRGFVLKPHFF